MVGDGDSFSTSGAEIFELEADNNGIDICMKANYEAGSLDMEAPIKQIIDSACCLVTVVFGQDRDISSLLLEAHRQNYAGEWVMSENIIDGLDGIIESLKKDLDEPSIHKLLRGMFECIWKQALHFPQKTSHRLPCVIATTVCTIVQVDRNVLLYNNGLRARKPISA